MRTLKTRLRPLLLVAALGLITGVLLTPVGLAHVDRVGDKRGPTPAASDGESRLGAAASTDHQQHCDTCHWLQSFRSTLLAPGTVVVQATGTCLLPTGAIVRIVSASDRALQARAPPRFPDDVMV